MSYAYAAIARQAGLIFTAGICPLDEGGAVVAPGDVTGQARQTISNLRRVLDECGVTLRDVAKTTVYVVSNDRDELRAAWTEVGEAFGDHCPPSTLLGVAVLGYPGQLVEIEAIVVGAGFGS